MTHDASHYTITGRRKADNKALNWRLTTYPAREDAEVARREYESLGLFADLRVCTVVEAEEADRERIADTVQAKKDAKTKRETRSKRFILNLTPSEHERFDEQARNRGMNLSTFIRFCVYDTIRKGA